MVEGRGAAPVQSQKMVDAPRVPEGEAQDAELSDRDAVLEAALFSNYSAQKKRNNSFIT